MDEKLLEKIRQDAEVRKKLGQESFAYFMAIYFPRYLSYESSEMHNEMFRVAEDTKTKLSVVVAFRGSAKSTIFSLVYPIWAVLGCQNKKFVILASNTQKQSSLHFANLKRELENNEILKSDFGPFIAEDGDWSNSRLIVSPTNARIMAASVDQNIRGARHDQYRPDLVIADDIEDLESVKTLEGRDKIERWLTGDILPIGDQNTKIVIVGNLLHEDSVLMRLKERNRKNPTDSQFLEFPLLDEKGNIAWPGKYPDMAAIEKERALIGNDIAWYREYMLKIISPDGQLIKPEWLKFYDEFPKEKYRYYAHGVDLAISNSSFADYTAVVSIKVYGIGDELRMYVMAHPINKRLDFPEAIQEIQNLHNTLPGKIYIEEVAFQGTYIQVLQKMNYPVEGVKPHGQDKRMRANGITPAIKNGVILFPRNGCETLIRQMTGFGVEKHDDLLDALVYVASKTLEEIHQRKVTFEFI